MKYTTDSEQLKETSRCLAVSVFLTTNCFVSHAILTVSEFDLFVSAMYSLYMLYIHTYIYSIHTHTNIRANALKLHSKATQTNENEKRGGESTVILKGEKFVPK
jgi:hypothetical protein